MKKKNNYFVIFEKSHVFNYVLVEHCDTGDKIFHIGLENVFEKYFST